MKKHTITIRLHSSISSKLKILKKEFEEGTILLNALTLTLSPYKELSDLLILNDKIKPGFLLLANKIELKTTKKLYAPIVEDLIIRVIPISHGG
ncbi:MAG: hypothetical protein KAS95_01510 [Candidatus Heimdallarchaeota archaeon]|nr:hypothetical protein [Candidatus Heimdallarchaeota archaeon]